MTRSLTIRRTRGDDWGRWPGVSTCCVVFIIQIEAHMEMLLLLFPYSEDMTEEATAAILQPHGQKPQAKAGGSKTKSLRKLCNHYGDIV